MNSKQWLFLKKSQNLKICSCNHHKISFTLSLGTIFKLSAVQMFGNKILMTNFCVSKVRYRNYSGTRHNLQGKLNIDFFHENPSNVNDLMI